MGVVVDQRFVCPACRHIRRSHGGMTHVVGVVWECYSSDAIDNHYAVPLVSVCEWAAREPGSDDDDK